MAIRLSSLLATTALPVPSDSRGNKISVDREVAARSSKRGSKIEEEKSKDSTTEVGRGKGVCGDVRKHRYARRDLKRAGVMIVMFPEKLAVSFYEIVLSFGATAVLDAWLMQPTDHPLGHREKRKERCRKREREREKEKERSINMRKT